MFVNPADEHFLELLWRKQVRIVDNDIEIKIKADIRFRVHGDHVTGCTANELVLECEFLPQVVLDIVEQFDNFIAEWRP